MFYLIPVIFLLGIVGIALEDFIKVNKAAIALFMAISLWVILMLDADAIFIGRHSEIFQGFLDRFPEVAKMPLHEQFVQFLTDRAIVYHLGNVAETLFFIMSSMVIVELIDRHGGFRSITDLIRTSSKRKLLWAICFISFFFSALLDNLAASIVIIAILRKLVPLRQERIIFACMVIIAANAGGSWSPIGDVTTILLWVGQNISAGHQIVHVFIPALVNLLVPLTIATFVFFKKGEHIELQVEEPEDDYIPEIPKRARYFILIVGVLSLALVPVFQSLTSLPPFLGIMLGLVILWFYTDIMYSRLHGIEESQKLRIATLLTSVDLGTILFFTGILMAVGALETSGQLGLFANFLDTNVHQPYIISFVIGLMSSVVDNVALVAATIGMYPIADPATGLTEYVGHFVKDGGFWTFLAYCAVTGGSILIIGSATGVTVMGLEKINFMYYTKKFTLLALLGYVSGALVYMAMFS